MGEGTWPSMRNTLNRIGINEIEFIKCCDASFKQGSKFIGWNNGQQDDYYYHPFMTPDGYVQTNLHAGWQQLEPTTPFADAINVQSHVCQAGLAPKQLATPQYAAVTNYGYHLNAGKFAALLQKHCTEILNVTHIIDHMVSIESLENGDISALHCKNSGAIAGDLFIDCSGNASLLLGKHYNIPFIEQRQTLFNDCAIATQVPYVKPNSDIASATLSTAQTAGWIWDIGLQNRRGVGHTYSSAHMDDATAEKLLLQYIESSANKDIAKTVEPRKLSFNPGYREKFWQNNCVAVGMSSGFLEPLEASALALVELSATMISDELPVTRAQMEITAKRYNERFTYRWERTVEFLKLHYCISGRTDSDYWRDNKVASSIPQRLQELLAFWRFQSPSRYDFIQNEEIFSSASYQYVLYGMHFNTQMRPFPKRFDNIELAKSLFADNVAKTERYLAGLPRNRQLIDHLCSL